MNNGMSIVVRFSFEGIHSWQGAKGDEIYLQYPHRHLFSVEALKDVTHEDRDIEFIAFRKKLKLYCEKMFSGPHGMSCEHMARDLLIGFELRSCRVLEDDENGAEVRW